MEYKLLFEDDFSEKKLNEKYWNIIEAGNGFGNNELQYYTNREKNLKIEDGILKIIGLKEKYKHLNYTSAKITTAKKVYIKYGKVIVRAKMPKGKGAWPAIWMMPEDSLRGVPWPLCGEIDIMEYVGRNPDEVLFTIHTEKYNHRIGTQVGHIEKFENLSEEFKDYEIRWNEKGISYYVDNRHVKTIEKTGESVEAWPFDKEFYLIINLALGGNLGKEIDDTIFPAVFEIESVKIYEGR